MFAVSCSDECKLFLSSDDQEAKKKEIINHPSDSARDMSSEYIKLKAGRSYYIESQSMQNEWVSPVRVGVRIPNGDVIVPISREFIRPQRSGLYDEIFYNVSDASVKDLIHDASFPNSPNKGRALSDFAIREDKRSSIIGHHVSGYFLAPETGKFNFFGACSQSCKLFLSSDESCNRRSLVLDYNSAKESPKFDVSRSVDLEAGLHYFIDALQVVKSNEQNSMKMGVIMPSGKASFPIKKNYLQQFPPSEHGVIREVWTGIRGQDVRDLMSLTSFPNLPSSVNILDSFDAPYNDRFNYGQRIRGQFVAPMTGDYRFVMSCDRKCELWLSNGEREERKKVIIKQNHATARHQFERYPNEQVSRLIHLEIGEQYFIEALHKASTGLDHLSVGVTLPNGQNEWPIPLKYLRVKPKKNTESHLKDPPCTFEYNEGQPPLRNSTQSKNTTTGKEEVESLPAHLTSDLIHEWDSLHKSQSNAEIGRIKDDSHNSELGLDLGAEAPYKAMHDLKNKAIQSMIGPAVELGDHHAISSGAAKEEDTLSSMLKAAKGINTEMVSMLGKDKKEQDSSAKTGLHNIIDNLSAGHGEKLKIIRIKTEGSLSDEDILNSLKEMSEAVKPDASLHDATTTTPTTTKVLANHMQDQFVDSMATLGTFSNGQDYESQQLAKIPAEDAQKILAELAKPKLPPEIENSDGIKVAGDAGGNLQVMEQNPFSNHVYGSHDNNAIDVTPSQSDAIANFKANGSSDQKSTLANSLMSEGQSVNVVGNMAVLNAENDRLSPVDHTNDASTAVGEPIDSDDNKPSVTQDAHVSHHVPINHVSDYDILDLDLAGLKQLSKNGLPMDSVPSPTGMGMADGNYPQQITDEIEQAPFTGESSLLTDNDANGVAEYYKRAKLNIHPNVKLHGPLKSSRKTAKKIAKKRAEKRTMIASSNEKKSFHLRRNSMDKPIKPEKKQWIRKRKKESFKPLGTHEILHQDMEYGMHHPARKNSWRMATENVISRSKIENDLKQDDKIDRFDVIQGLLQPSTSLDNADNGYAVSKMIKNIEKEVDGEDSSPLDDYIDGIKQHLSRNPNIVPRHSRKRNNIPKTENGQPKSSVVIDDSDLIR